MDEWKVLTQSLSVLLDFRLRLLIALDSRDIFTSLGSQRNSVARSIRADFNVIRYEYETRYANEIIWIPGCGNLTDSGTKSDSPLSKALQLIFRTGNFSLDMFESASRSGASSVGYADEKGSSMIFVLQHLAVIREPSRHFCVVIMCLHIFSS